jgi:hypothetical protein
MRKTTEQASGYKKGFIVRLVWFMSVQASVWLKNYGFCKFTRNLSQL